MLATMQEAVREYAEVVGRDNADRQWVLSPYDTWELNPFIVVSHNPILSVMTSNTYKPTAQWVYGLLFNNHSTNC